MTATSTAAAASKVVVAGVAVAGAVAAGVAAVAMTVATAAEAAAQILTRAELQSQYESALLDMGRIVFSYQWSRAKFDGVPNLNRNSYNKHAPNAAWLVARCDALLAERGQ